MLLVLRLPFWVALVLNLVVLLFKYAYGLLFMVDSYLLFSYCDLIVVVTLY